MEDQIVIRIKQIEQTELSNFVTNLSTGSSFDAALLDYFANTGWLGNGVVYASGSDQNIYGTKIFSIAPYIPTGDLNLSGAASKLYVNDKISGQLIPYSGWSSGEYVSRSLSQTVAGTKTFSSNVFVPRASDTGHAMNLRDGQIISGVLRSGIDSVTVANVLYNGAVANQRITGQLIFDISPLVAIPTNGSGAVPYSMLTGVSVLTAVSKTGLNETISGIKTFVNAPVVPIALNANEAIRKSQLDAAINLLVAASGTGQFVGVASVNSQSGRVFLEGINGIFVQECSGILYISGTAANTNLYSLSIPLSSGITGISYNYGSGFSAKPNVVGTLEYAGQTNLQFVDDVIFNSTTGGFNVAFSTGIPSTGYYYNFEAIPTGSGLLGVKGDRGFPAYNFRQRGAHTIGVQYLPYDVVFTPGNFVSFWTTGTFISDSFNAPSGTGSSLWQILSSGNQGPTGYYIFRGVHSTGTVYNQKDSVTYDGSSYVYSGNSPASGFTPENLTGGWGLIAAKAPLGYFINSGTITGNFVGMSYFLSPASTTGLDLYEVISPSTFYCTGFAIMASVTGAGPQNGGLFSGRLYTKDLSNVKTIFKEFTFNSGLASFISGDFSQPITGFHRVGIDVRNTLSGIDKVSIGVFGFGT